MNEQRVAPSSAEAESCGTTSTGNAKWATRAAWALLLVGTALRLRGLLAGGAFWLDEVFLLESFVQLGPRDLLGPLLLYQTAPLGWVLVHDALHSLGGADEFLLRLPSTLASILTLPLVLRLGKKLVGPRWALLPLGLVAMGPFFIWQGMQMKPYATDAFVSTLLLVFAMRAEERGGMGLLTAVGAAAVLFSAPSIFVLAGVATVIFVRSVSTDASGDRTHGPLTPKTILASASLWGVLGAAHVSLYLQPGSRPDWLYAYWSEGLLPSLRPDIALRWVIRIVAAALERPTGLMGLGLVALPVLFLGILALSVPGARSRTRIALIAAPVAVALGAATLRLYPFQDRLILFAAPSLALLLGLGVRQAVRLWPRGRPLILAASIAAICVPTAATGVWSLHGLLPTATDVPELIARLDGARKPEDVLIIGYVGSFAWDAYSGPAGATARQSGFSASARVQPLREAIEQSTSSTAWVVLARAAHPTSDIGLRVALAADIRDRTPRLDSTWSWLVWQVTDFASLQELAGAVPDGWEIREEIRVHGGALWRLEAVSRKRGGGDRQSMSGA